jgi:ankyrin repeat protein
MAASSSTASTARVHGWLEAHGFSLSDLLQSAPSRRLNWEATTGTAFFEACALGELEVCRWLHGHDGSGGASARAENSQGMSPLFVALLQGHFHVANWLYDGEAVGAAGDVRKTDRAGRTPLWCAARDGRLDVAVWLHAHGAADDVRTATALGCTPLWIAAQNGQLHLLQWLVAHGARDTLQVPNQAVRRSRRPLFKASQGGFMHTVRWLLEQGAAAGDHGHTDP